MINLTHQVVKIADSDIRDKIHQTFRLQYLKDVVLARILDDPTFSILNSLIFFNQVDIVNYLQQDEDYLRELFTLLQQHDNSRSVEALKFLQQFCSIAKSLQAMGRSAFYRQLIKHGFFDVIKYALNSDDLQMRGTGVDIVRSAIDHDANLVRTFVLEDVKSEFPSLLDAFVRLLRSEQDAGIKAQMTDMLKVLLDVTPRLPENFTELDVSMTQRTALTDNIIID